MRLTENLSYGYDLLTSNTEYLGRRRRSSHCQGLFTPNWNQFMVIGVALGALAHERRRLIVLLFWLTNLTENDCVCRRAAVETRSLEGEAAAAPLNEDDSSLNTILGPCFQTYLMRGGAHSLPENLIMFHRTVSVWDDPGAARDTVVRQRHLCRRASSTVALMENLSALYSFWRNARID